jgi:hypothetical protein
MKLFHPNYSGVDVGVGGRQYPVESAGNGGVCVSIPDSAAALLFEHGFRAFDTAGFEPAPREPSKARTEATKRGGVKARG